MQNNTRAHFPLYSAADLTRRRHSLIGKRKQADQTALIARQTELAEAAEMSGNSFIGWFEGIAVETHSPELAFRASGQELAAREIANPQLTTEQESYRILSDLPLRLAALPSFWTSYQVEMVRRGLIDPADLATQISTTLESGRSRLQKAIRRSKKTLLDSCTRTILRQLGGLPEERGHVSVFVDCRLSRSWWRGYLSHQVAEDMRLDVDDVWNFLRLATAPWDELQQYTVKRLTVVADRNIRSPLIARLMELDLEAETSKERRRRTQAFFARVGARCAYQALGTLSPKQNLAIFRHIDV